MQEDPGMDTITFWGVIASPFQLKMQALADYASLQWQRWPDEATTVEAIGASLRLSIARRKQTIERVPRRISGLDEYPAVPYYSFDKRQFYYDSTGLAHHLGKRDGGKLPLLPEQPQTRFICQLIDEAFDEFGLYMVHHNRWVTSAATNSMARVTSQEMRKLLPPGMRQHMVRRLQQRQARRCTYLFSVAPEGFDLQLGDRPTPPATAGFPATHTLLDTSWRRYLAAMETVLQHQPFLLGDRFTLADASAYGQLSMNLIDGKAGELLEQLAPVTFRWLCMIRDGEHVNSTGELYLSEQLLPLLDIIGETFTPLMRQNQAAYTRALSRGQTLFNEAAFDRGKALYDGSLLGMPFRAVVKTFQVAVWRDLCQYWQQLQQSDREQLQLIYPSLSDAQFVTADQ
jgi:glutathione S-transferase